MLEAALLYATAGYPVFPIAPRGKHPLTKHGFKDATIDADTIRKWWQRWPDANIGIPTGDASGLYVVDADTPEGVAWLEHHGLINDITPRQRTSKGIHLFYRYDASLGLRNTARYC